VEEVDIVEGDGEGEGVDTAMGSDVGIVVDAGKATSFTLGVKIGADVEVGILVLFLTSNCSGGGFTIGLVPKCIKVNAIVPQIQIRNFFTRKQLPSQLWQLLLLPTTLPL
jgi:hypothetical protein